MAYTFKHGDRPLDGYTIQRAVGRGGFGEVYYALSDSGKQVALKYLRDNPEVELRGVAQVMNLKSPHLISIFDVKHSPNGDPWVIMEYVSGPSLHDLLVAEPNGIGPQKAAYFLSGIAKGLKYLHDGGVVHRDLKPGNIFYDNGYVTIGDYGLSKHMSVSKHSGQTVSVGTVHYMAPEIGSGSYTKAIDIYALGVILYEMLTGKLPFTGSSLGEVLMRHLSDNPDMAGIPEPFASVIAKALAKDPKDRYQDAAEMAEAVTSSVDIGQSLNSFDHASLYNVPRAGVVSEADPTLSRTPGAAIPRPVRPVPPLPPLPPLDARSIANLGALPGKLGKKADKLRRKLEKKLDKHRAKFEKKRLKRSRAVFGDQPEPAPPRAKPAPAVQAGREGASAGKQVTFGNRATQTFTLLLVTVGVALGLGFITAPRTGMREEAPVVLGLMMAGGTLGLLLAYFGILRRSLTRNWLTDRVTYAMVGGAFMIPAALVANEAGGLEYLHKLIIPAIAVLFLCDWSSRIELGRRRNVDVGEAVAPAIIGLVAGAMTHTPVLAAAGVCAALSLLTQAAASMWPVPFGGGLGTPRNPSPDNREKDRRPGNVDDALNEGQDSLDKGLGGGGLAAAYAEETARETAVAQSGAEIVRKPRSAALRGFFGVLATVALAGSAGCFFTLVLAPVYDFEARSALLFGTLALAAWQPFLLTKAFGKYKRPLWRGSLRMFIASSGLTLTAGMIALVSYASHLHIRGGEFGAAIFGLVAGAVVALVSICVPGGRWPRVRRPRQVAAAPSEPRAHESSRDELAAAGTPSFVGRTANAGLSFLAKCLLLSGFALTIVYAGGDFELKDKRNDGIAFSSGTLTVLDRTEQYAPIKIPPVLPVIPIVLGGVMLLAARRNDGAAHFLRGLAGLLFGVIAAIMAITVGSKGLQAFLSNDWGELTKTKDFAAPVFVTAVLLFVSLAAVFWPRGGRSRTLVV